MCQISPGEQGRLSETQRRRTQGDDLIITKLYLIVSKHRIGPAGGCHKMSVVIFSTELDHAFQLPTGVPRHLPFGVELFATNIAVGHVNAHERQRTAKDVPLLADLRKSEMVTPHMTKYVFMMLPDPFSVAQAAGVVWNYAFFSIDGFEKGSVNPSRLNPKLFCMYFRIREQPSQRL